LSRGRDIIDASIEGRMVMKKSLILLLITVLAAPVAVLADVVSDNNPLSNNSPMGDSNAASDNTATGVSNTKIDFNLKCAKCHGATKSLPKTAKLLGVDPEKLALRGSKMTRDEMIAIIEKGRDKMPGFEKEMTKAQITDIADYIIFMKKRSNIRSSPSSPRLY
jgi:mono/diheme cytochrome c family protein